PTEIQEGTSGHERDCWSEARHSHRTHQETDDRGKTRAEELEPRMGFAGRVSSRTHLVGERGRTLKEDLDGSMRWLIRARSKPRSESTRPSTGGQTGDQDPASYNDGRISGYGRVLDSGGVHGDGRPCNDPRTGGHRRTSSEKKAPVQKIEGGGVPQMRRS